MPLTHYLAITHIAQYSSSSRLTLYDESPKSIPRVSSLEIEKTVRIAYWSVLDQIDRSLHEAYISKGMPTSLVTCSTDAAS